MKTKSTDGRSKLSAPETTLLDLAYRKAYSLRPGPVKDGREIAEEYRDAAERVRARRERLLHSAKA